MKMKKLLLTLILAVVSSSAISEENDEGVSIYGLGGQQCGIYLSNRQEIDKNSYKGTASGVYAAYFHGLLSGYNLTTTGVQSVTKFPVTTIIAYLDNFCRTKPLKPLLNGYNCLMRSSGIETTLEFSCE